MTRTPRSRRPAQRRRQLTVFRPFLTVLEDRLPPGDTVLGTQVLGFWPEALHGLPEPARGAVTPPL
jgi:hypothetical protein